MKSRSGFLLLVAVSLVLGLVLRVLEADKSFWLDELHTTELAAAGPAGMIDMLREDFHAPLFYLGVAACRVVGLEGHGLRVLPIILNLLCAIPLLLLASRMKASAEGRLVMLAVLLFSPFQLRYGAELRPYSALMFLSLLMVWAAWDDGASRRIRFLVFAGAAAAALYTHYLAACVIVGIGFIRLFHHREGILSFSRVVVAGTLGVVLFMPWILTMESWLIHDPEALVRADDVEVAKSIEEENLPGFDELKSELLAVVPRTLAPGAASLGAGSRRLVLGGIALVGTLILAGLLLAVRNRPPCTALLNCALAGVVAMVLAGLLCVKFWHRIPIQYFAVGAWCWPFLALVSVDAWLSGRARRLAALLIAAGLLLAAVGEIRGAPREDLQGAVALAADVAADEGAHLTAVMRQPAQYAHGEIYRIYLDRGHAVEPEAVPADDGRSVVVVTRRVELAEGMPPDSTEGRLLRSREIVWRRSMGRAVAVFLLRPQRNK